MRPGGLQREGGWARKWEGGRLRGLWNGGQRGGGRVRRRTRPWSSRRGRAPSWLFTRIPAIQSEAVFRYNIIADRKRGAIQNSSDMILPTCLCPARTALGFQMRGLWPEVEGCWEQLRAGVWG